MSELRIAGILRASVYSPNHIGNDAAILNAVAEQLRKRGCEVKIYSEDQLLAGKIDEQIIINMCREPRSIALLQQLEDNGCIVINSGYGIENCTRERMTRIIVGSNIPHPESFIVNTNEMVRNTLKKAGISQCWIKRADCHAMHKEDVTYVRHAEEAQEVLQEYFLRGINRAVINRHIEGRLVKFYGVKNQPFFYIFYPQEELAKQSHNIFATKNAKISAQEKAILDIAMLAAEELGVDIFGGEFILDNNNVAHLIDFNDWSSFAPCRSEAAPHIAKSILTTIKARQEKQQWH